MSNRMTFKAIKKATPYLISCGVVFFSALFAPLVFAADGSFYFDFEDYNNGALWGQDGWNGPDSFQPRVYDNFSYSGSKSVSTNEGGFNSARRTQETPLYNVGKGVSFWYYLNRVPSSSFELFKVMNSNNSGGTLLRLMTDGTLQYLDNNTSYQPISEGLSLTQGQWCQVFIEIDFDNDKARFAVDDSGWTQWYDVRDCSSIQWISFIVDGVDSGNYTYIDLIEPIGYQDSIDVPDDSDHFGLSETVSFSGECENNGTDNYTLWAEGVLKSTFSCSDHSWQSSFSLDVAGTYDIDLVYNGIVVDDLDIIIDEADGTITQPTNGGSYASTPFEYGTCTGEQEDGYILHRYYNQPLSYAQIFECTEARQNSGYCDFITCSEDAWEIEGGSWPIGQHLAILTDSDYEILDVSNFTLSGNGERVEIVYPLDLDYQYTHSCGDLDWEFRVTCTEDCENTTFGIYETDYQGNITDTLYEDEGITDGDYYTQTIEATANRLYYRAKLTLDEETTYSINFSNACDIDVYGYAQQTEPYEISEDEDVNWFVERLRLVSDYFTEKAPVCYFTQIYNAIYGEEITTGDTPTIEVTIPVSELGGQDVTFDLLNWDNVIPQEAKDYLRNLSEVAVWFLFVIYIAIRATILFEKMR